MATSINTQTQVNASEVVATPAIVVEKAKKVFNVEEGMYEVDWSDCQVEITAETAKMFANIMLPNNLELADPDDYKRLEVLKSRQKQIAELILSTGFQPFPLPEEIVLVFRDGKEKEIPAHLLTSWLVFQVQIIAVKEAKDKGEIKYRLLADKEFSTKEILHFDMGINSIRLAERILKAATIQNGESIEGCFNVYADELASFYASFVALQMTKLTDLQVAELATLLRPELEVINEDGEIGVLAPKDNQDYYFSFSNKWVTTRSGRNPKILDKTVIWMQTCNSRFTLFNLAMWLGSSKFEGSVDGEYSKIPNLFSRITEDGGNSYSIEWEPDHPTRIINEDLRMPVAFVAKKDDASLSVYPFVFPTNVRHNPALLSMIIKREGDATCDKYNTTFVAGAKASNAAGTYLINGKKRSLHDMKGTKMLNRPMQARKHMSASAELLQADGTVISLRERSLFTVKMEEENQG